MNLRAQPAPVQRHVVLHNHLFKNAGTSIDHILKTNFGPTWQTREFPSPGQNNTEAVAEWISSTPHGVAFSSHTLMGPLPRIEGIQIHPILMLRDPVERIASAYRFERAQDAETRGAKLAKAHGFAGYVHARIAIEGDRQCQNFQTQRLASLMPDHPGNERARACAALAEIARTGVLGLVSDFEAAMGRLSHVLLPHYPQFTWRPVTANASGPESAHTVSPDMRDMLRRENADDLALVREAQRLLRQTPAGVGTLHEAGMA